MDSFFDNQETEPQDQPLCVPFVRILHRNDIFQDISLGGVVVYAIRLLRRNAGNANLDVAPFFVIFASELIVLDPARILQYR